MIRDKLEILLVTYNRKEYLQRTFNQILSNTSPIRNFDITILDNASTDGTSELIEEYCKKMPNLRHIRHKINIGGDANICRAFELGVSSGKEYVWVLCDDDKFDFSNWNMVENEIANGTDIVCVANYVFPKESYFKNKAYQIFQLTFVPAGIYKTSLINNTVLTNMYNATYTLFQQSCITIEAINKNKHIAVLKNAIVDSGLHYEDACCDVSYTRATDKNNILKRRKYISWILGYSNILYLLKNVDFEKDCMDIAIPHVEIFGSWHAFYDRIITLYFNYDKFEYFFEIFKLLKNKRKALLLFNLVSPINFYKDKNHNVICIIASKLKIKIYSSKWFEFILSIKNEGKYKILRILGFTIKLNRINGSGGGQNPAIDRLSALSAYIFLPQIFVLEGRRI